MSDVVSAILVLYLLINASAFTVVGLDKKKSARRDETRVPEVYFLFWSAVFGALGTLIGMLIFRHKIRKFYLVFAAMAILVQQIVLMFFIYGLFR